MRIDVFRIVLRVGLMADRADHPAIERVELIERGPSDRYFVPFDFQPGLARRRSHDLDAFRHHFKPDVVAFENSYFQRAIHLVTLIFSLIWYAWTAMLPLPAFLR